MKKDKRKHHGVVDKHPSDQQFHKSDEITFVVKKFWSQHLEKPSLMTQQIGWQAGRQIMGGF